MKRLISILVAVFLLALLVIPVSGAETPEACVYDGEMLLTDEEYWTLEDYAQEISDLRQCAVYFVSVEDYRDYGEGDIFNVARQIFLDNDFGMGEEKDGVMLILSMADRDYSLIVHGFGETALTDYGREYICEHFLDDFADDDWFHGVYDYLSYTDDLLSQAREGKIYDRYNWITGGVLWVWSLILGVVISLIVCTVQRAMMRKKVHEQTGALGYVQGDVHITRKRDVYSHTTEVRRKIEKNDSGSSGSHSHSFGGFSGTSGKF